MDNCRLRHTPRISQTGVRITKVRREGTRNKINREAGAPTAPDSFMLAIMLTIVALGAGAAIVNPPPVSTIHRAPASGDTQAAPASKNIQAAKIELDQCLALARLEVPEDHPYADEQPNADGCFNAYYEDTSHEF